MEFTFLADKDLSEIIRFGLERWNVEQVDVYVSELLEAIDKIGDNPRRGTVHTIRDGVEIRRLVHRVHVAYYEIEGDTAYVLRIMSGRAQTPVEFELHR